MCFFFFVALHNLNEIIKKCEEINCTHTHKHTHFCRALPLAAHQSRKLSFNLINVFLSITKICITHTHTIATGTDWRSTLKTNGQIIDSKRLGRVMPHGKKCVIYRPSRACRARSVNNKICMTAKTIRFFLCKFIEKRDQLFPHLFRRLFSRD